MNGGAQWRSPQRAAIVLAGGDGTRLRDLTRRIAGQYIPKQFCPLIGSSTLLEQTFDRIARVVAPEHTLTVVNRRHERFYAPLLGHLPGSRLLAQPENRGTAVAISYALFRMAQSAPEASVALFPSDHYIDDDAEFMRHVEYAFEVVEERPEHTREVELGRVERDCAGHVLLPHRRGHERVGGGARQCIGDADDER